jgi:hypothetical protein
MCRLGRIDVGTCADGEPRVARWGTVALSFSHQEPAWPRRSGSIPRCVRLQEAFNTLSVDYDTISGRCSDSDRIAARSR